jgi:hypothetical protein
MAFGDFIVIPYLKFQNLAVRGPTAHLYKRRFDPKSLMRQMAADRRVRVQEQEQAGKKGKCGIASSDVASIEAVANG